MTRLPNGARTCARVVHPLVLASLASALSTACEPPRALPLDAARLVDAGVPAVDASPIDAPAIDARSPSTARPLALALGAGFSCAHDDAGDVRCWGRGQDGELGDDARRHRPGCRVDEDCSARPVRVALEGPARVVDAHGGPGACAIDALGRARCWGLDPFYSSASSDVRRAPVTIDLGSLPLSSIANAVWLLCAIDAASEVRCMGRNDLGQLGRGAFGARTRDASSVLTRSGDPLRARSVAVGIGGRFACAVADDAVWCWGVGDRGELGATSRDVTPCWEDRATPRSCASHPLPVEGLVASEVAELALGLAHACARLASGRVACWGDGSSGALGTGEREGVTAPVELALEGIVSIAAGALHTCALDEHGFVWCWGGNDSGQLGDGVGDHPGEVCRGDGSAFDCSEVPVAVALAERASVLAAGAMHSCAITLAGEVWCWGRGETMQLGDGRRSRTMLPVRVAGL